MEKIATKLDGMFVLRPDVFRDQRGVFVKTYQQRIFADLGISFIPAEEFFSVSERDVIRGMHFQVPPADHAKVVYCLSGSILDVVVDLRKSSNTYGQCWSGDVNDANRELVFIPPGCAHGFLSRSASAVVVYLTSAAHSPNHDCGIRWNSFGFEWPCVKPIMSERDRNFPTLEEFNSPFD
jgi:dTDP-4-dehydrorhamnose 3,5-epimerase